MVLFNEPAAAAAGFFTAGIAGREGLRSGRPEAGLLSVSVA
jgi:hypothetical protein